MVETRIIGPTLGEDSLQKSLLAYSEDNVDRKDHGVWEIRGDKHYFTHGRVMMWAAFDRCIRAVEEFGVLPSDRIGAQASLTFDLSTFDVFGSAMAGACLVLLPDALKAFPRDVVDWLARERVSIFYAVPTLYQQLLRRGGIDTAPPPDLRVIAFAGEPFPVEALQSYVDAFPGADFYNLYGPTETNVCTFEKLPPTWSAKA